MRDKQEMAAPAEQSKTGFVFAPNVDIFENAGQITLLVDMPGVAPDDVKIDPNDSVLRTSGEVKPFESKDGSDVRIEIETG